MPIRDIFRPPREPEWKHPDVTVRAAAVRHLGDDQQELLRTLAQEDPAPQVRRVAIQRIRDSRVIAALLLTETDEAVRDEAFSSLVSTAVSSADPSASEAALAALVESRHVAAVAKGAVLEVVRRAAVVRLADAKALGQVARDAQDPATRLAALEKIEDAGVLSSVAVSSEHKDVALAAVERIRKPEALRPVAARAHNKAAARRARALLQNLAPPPEAVSPSERHRRQHRFCETLEALARSQDWLQVAHELAETDAAWQECQDGADPAMAARFQAARQTIAARLSAHEREFAEAEARKQAWDRGIEERTHLCERAEALSSGDATSSLEELREAWNRLEAFDDAVAGALGQRFQRALQADQAHRDAEEAAQALRPQAEALCLEAEAAAEDPDLREAFRLLGSVERRWAEMHGARPGPPELAERLRQASTRLRERQAQSRADHEKEARQHGERVDALCAQLEALLAQPTPNLRDAERALRESREALDKPGAFPSREQRESGLARLKAARQALYPRIQEFKENAEWQHWANLGVQEDLCQKVEALLPREDLEAVAEELRQIDALWKQAGSVPKDKGEALWHRFRVAREQLRTRCDAFFAARAVVHAENLKKKEELCARAEALADSTEWVKTAQEVQALQAEWKTLGPVSRSHSKAIWERFHAACDTFFRRRKEDRSQRRHEWAKNREQKEAFCARAEAMAGSTDWERTAAELRKLQAEWKAGGPVDRKHSDALWQRFRSACQSFFERYAKRDEIEREGLTQGLTALCAEMESLIPAEGAAPEPPTDLADRVQKLQAAWRQARGGAESPTSPLAARFADARARVVAAYPAAFRGSDLDPEASRKKMEKLCARVEALADELVPVRPEATTQVLVERLRDALAFNTIGGKAAVEERWRSAWEELEAAQAAWHRLGPSTLGVDEARVFSERFERACARLQSAKPRPSSGDRGRRPAHPGR